MSECTCPMRDGAHEWVCGKVREYDFVHCKDCDGVVWMCGVAYSRCKRCRDNWEHSQEYEDERINAVLELMKRVRSK